MLGGTRARDHIEKRLKIFIKRGEGERGGEIKYLLIRE